MRVLFQTKSTQKWMSRIFDPTRGPPAWPVDISDIRLFCSITSTQVTRPIQSPLYSCIWLRHNANYTLWWFILTVNFLNADTLRRKWIRLNFEQQIRIHASSRLETNWTFEIILLQVTDDNIVVILFVRINRSVKISMNRHFIFICIHHKIARKHNNST